MSDEENAQGEVVFQLSADEALILFNLLSRWIDEEGAATPSPQNFENSSECAVLHRMLCILEKQMSAPLSADYRRLVQNAQERLADRWDGTNLRG